MSNCCDDRCAAIRLRTAKGEPVSPILWLNSELTELASFVAPSKSKLTGANVDTRFNVVKRQRKLVGEILIWELDIAEQDPRPKTVTGRLRAWWADGLEDRRANPELWYGAGGLVAFVLAMMLAGLAFSGIGNALLNETLASMIWVWHQFGRALPFVVAAILITLCVRATLGRRPFWAGLFFVGCLFGPALAVILRDALFGQLGPNAVFPESYREAGASLFDLVLNEDGTFDGNIAALWSVVTLLANGAGLAGLVAAVDTIAGIVMAVYKADDTDRNSTADMTAPEGSSVRDQSEGLMIAQASGGTGVRLMGGLQIDQRAQRLDTVIDILEAAGKDIPRQSDRLEGEELEAALREIEEIGRQERERLRIEAERRTPFLLEVPLKPIRDPDDRIPPRPFAC